MIDFLIYCIVAISILFLIFYIKIVIKKIIVRYRVMRAKKEANDYYIDDDYNFIEK
jgi:ABC-type transport system involved in Fe-S cluster assembly fused permease/ATPase subunit